MAVRWIGLLGEGHGVVSHSPGLSPQRNDASPRAGGNPQVVKLFLWSDWGLID